MNSGATLYDPAFHVMRIAPEEMITFSQATRALAQLERSDLPHKQICRALSMLFQNNDLLMEELKAVSISNAVMDSCLQRVASVLLMDIPHADTLTIS